MSDSRDNAFLRAQDQRSVETLVAEIEDLRRQVNEMRSLPQQGLYLMPWPRVLPPITVTAGHADFPLPKKYGGLLGFGGSVYVATTNNTSNYWTVDLTSVTTGLVIARFDTRNSAPNAFVQYFTKTVINAPSAAETLFYSYVTKTGAPGALFPDLYVSIL